MRRARAGRAEKCGTINPPSPLLRGRCISELTELNNRIACPIEADGYPQAAALYNHISMQRPMYVLAATSIRCNVKSEVSNAGGADVNLVPRR